MSIAALILFLKVKALMRGNVKAAPGPRSASASLRAVEARWSQGVKPGEIHSSSMPDVGGHYTRITILA